jgi:hypothetical protein
MLFTSTHRYAVHSHPPFTRLRLIQASLTLAAALLTAHQHWLSNLLYMVRNFCYLSQTANLI